MFHVKKFLSCKSPFTHTLVKLVMNTDLRTDKHDVLVNHMGNSERKLQWHSYI